MDIRKTDIRKFDIVPRVMQHVGKASVRISNLPPSLPKNFHLMNNVTDRPDARLLHVGKNISYSISGRRDVKAHWIDDDYEKATPRPDVYPYNVFTLDSYKMQPGILRHHAGLFADDLVLLVNGWNSSDVRNAVEREFRRIDAKWTVTLRIQMSGDASWDEGAAVFVINKRV